MTNNSDTTTTDRLGDICIEISDLIEKMGITVTFPDREMTTDLLYAERRLARDKLRTIRDELMQLRLDVGKRELFGEKWRE